MGRTSKPLSWLIHPSLVQTPEDHAFIEEKRSQGHVVDSYADWKQPGSCPLAHYDIILAPNAWRCFDELEKTWELAAKSARAVKFRPGAPRTTTKKKKSGSRRKKHEDMDVQHGPEDLLSSGTE